MIKTFDIYFKLPDQGKTLSINYFAKTTWIPTRK